MGGQLSDGKPYYVTKRRIRQLIPAPAMMRPVYRDDDGSYFVSGRQLVALALCTTREDTYVDGKLRHRGDRSFDEVCGIESYQADGLAVCEECSNLVGYIQAGEEPMEGLRLP